MEMNSIPWSPILRYATPLLMNRTPVSTIALQHKSVSSVLWYATPLPINRTERIEKRCLEGGGWINRERWRCLWMNRTPWCGGLDEQ